MTVTVQDLQLDRSSVTIQCDRCSRSATTDAMRRDTFLEMIGWCEKGAAVFCSSCQADLGMPPGNGTAVIPLSVARLS